ncbi:hypothetical protein Cs7R123_54690 [Catellatospora sp. TT07R-123]|uniref:hypothetical protein n=1 Tax=Catellatospora sp. TT07R-123 TaxID=2733863 RepID=UPI001B0F4519|nr:hypothetical protein [Catellatospora sp. TT07R-123]GHJ48127.1 hypothetical protein Cs7R123_54690 [Catellatospora sp. TT07R-123]
MASNFECVGLAVGDRAELAELVSRALAGAEPVGHVGGIDVCVWQDPSGVRLVFSLKNGKILDFVPSFAGTEGARLSAVRPANDEVAIANVVDGDGEMMTMLAVELEQRRLLTGAGRSVSGPASVIAFGQDVSVHADEDAFAASDASLLDPDDAGTEPPADHSEQGLPWPPRMGPESFISYGVFGPAEQAQALARLHGTVLDAQRRTVAATGQSFVVARVRTVGFETDLCLPDLPDAELPQPGNVIGGHVFLVASLPSLTSPDSARRSWLPWRR